MHLKIHLASIIKHTIFYIHNISSWEENFEGFVENIFFCILCKFLLLANSLWFFCLNDTNKLCIKQTKEFIKISPLLAPRGQNDQPPPVPISVSKYLSLVFFIRAVRWTVFVVRVPVDLWQWRHCAIWSIIRAVSIGTIRRSFWGHCNGHHSMKTKLNCWREIQTIIFDQNKGWNTSFCFHIYIYIYIFSITKHALTQRIFKVKKKK